MESLENLYNLMDESIITILGYDLKHEDIKDEFISRLKHYNVGEINSSFGVKSVMRDIKLDSVLGNEKCEYLVLDTMNIIVKKEDAGMSKSLDIKMILETFRTELLRKWDEQNETEFGLDFDDPQSHKQVKFKPEYKLIVTSPTYKTIGSELSGLRGISIYGGNYQLYVADLAGVITKDNFFEKPYIKVIKNRSGSNLDISIEDIIKTANRDKKINSILPK